MHIQGNGSLVYSEIPMLFLFSSTLFAMVMCSGLGCCCFETPPGTKP